MMIEAREGRNCLWSVHLLFKVLRNGTDSLIVLSFSKSRLPESTAVKKKLTGIQIKIPRKYLRMTYILTIVLSVVILSHNHPYIYTCK